MISWIDLRSLKQMGEGVNCSHQGCMPFDFWPV